MEQKAERVPADAFIFFGATGDLAQRKVYPALAAMVRKGRLKMPIILVARATHGSEDINGIIRQSLTEHGTFDEDTYQALVSQLKFVPGNYQDPELFPRVCAALGGARSPVAYLAIPPSMFGEVATGLATADCKGGMRLIVEKPFGRDRESARLLNETLHRHFPEPSIYRIDHYLGKEPVQNLIYFHLANELVNCSFHGQYVDHVQITMAETLGVEGRGKFYEEVGAIRDVVENHMLQVIACLAMECPASRQVEALRDEKARIIKAMRPLTREDVVRGQYRGYRQEPGVAPDSTIETYAAIRVRIDNDRWDGVPFYVRAGKRLPVGVTEIFVKYRQPLWTKVMEDRAITGNYLRLRLSPDTEIAEGTHVKKAGAQLQGQGLELVASYAPPEEMLPYERLFEDALAGDIELFGREDMIDAQWRVVDKVLNDLPPPYPYEQFTWGPSEASALLLGGATWHDPILEDRAVGAAAQGPAVKGRYPRRSNIRAVHQTEGARPAAVQPH